MCKLELKYNEPVNWLLCENREQELAAGGATTACPQAQQTIAHGSDASNSNCPWLTLDLHIIRLETFFESEHYHPVSNP